MKKSLFLVGLATLALAGCSQNEGVTGEGASNAIGFSTYTQKATKGAPVTGITLPTNSDFLVLGYSTGAANLATPAALNFMRQAVTYDGTSYTYSPIKYWPTDASAQLSFFAVYPAEVTGITPTAVSSTPSALPVVAYTVPTEPTRQVDLLLAGSVNNVRGASPTAPTVAFAFAHKLTKIGFTAALAGTYNGIYLRINSISLKDVANTATFQAAANGSWAMDAPTTFASTFTLNNLVHLTDNGSVSSTTAKDMVLGNSYPMMVPFTYDGTTVPASAGAAIVIDYTITYADGTSTTNTKTTTLSTLASAGYTWAAGSAITYALSFNLATTAVTFSASVGTWTDGGSTAIAN